MVKFKSIIFLLVIISTLNLIINIKNIYAQEDVITEQEIQIVSEQKESIPDTGIDKGPYIVFMMSLILVIVYSLFRILNYKKLLHY